MIFDYQNFSTTIIESLNPGLYIISTPIGNIEDITIRAIKILRSVDYIICEHHEITKKLLRYYNIKANILHYNDDMPNRHLHRIYDIIDRSKKIALVSDAGTPSISDPGFVIIKYLIDKNKRADLFSVPGPTSFVAALTLSGFSCNNFYFYGFLPRTEAKSSSILYKLLNVQSLLIFFESPYRLLNTLYLIYKVFGDVQISISKEITKLFEETFRGKISLIIEELEKKDSIKGEYIIIINNIENSHKISEENQDLMIKLIEFGVKNKKSTKDILQELIEKNLTNNMNKKDLYKLILEKNKKS